MAAAEAEAVEVEVAASEEVEEAEVAEEAAEIEEVRRHFMKSTFMYRIPAGPSTVRCGRS